ncbi:MAG: hypothetical protein EXS31_02515 [Pedosphaera sp.]|nr:hypothetical protein [Pedosphaera sp.]
MKTNIFDRTNSVVGWTIENSTQIQIFDRTGRMLGFYLKGSDATHTTHGFFGRGNQVMRLLK